MDQVEDSICPIAVVAKNKTDAERDRVLEDAMHANKEMHQRDKNETIRKKFVSKENESK